MMEVTTTGKEVSWRSKGTGKVVIIDVAAADDDDDEL